MFIASEGTYDNFYYEPGLPSFLQEAEFYDRSFGAGTYAMMMKHYEEEERFEQFMLDDDPHMCPSCRVTITRDEIGYLLFAHEEACEWVQWFEATHPNGR